MDPSSIFSEKQWNSYDNGENVTNGYVFRGKKAFEKVVNALKERLVKGTLLKLNEVTLKVLDSRKKGVELEIESEVSNKIEKGIALVKLYGPNKKKECVVTVSKSKDYDSTFLVMLAEKILKPLMESILMDEPLNCLSVVTAQPKLVQSTNIEKSDLQCIICEKVMKSVAVLKAH